MTTLSPLCTSDCAKLDQVTHTTAWSPTVSEKPASPLAVATPKKSSPSPTTNGASWKQALFVGGNGLLALVALGLLATTIFVWAVYALPAKTVLLACVVAVASVSLFTTTLGMVAGTRERSRKALSVYLALTLVLLAVYALALSLLLVVPNGSANQHHVLVQQGSVLWSGLANETRATLEDSFRCCGYWAAQDRSTSRNVCGAPLSTEVALNLTASRGNENAAVVVGTVGKKRPISYTFHPRTLQAAEAAKSVKLTTTLEQPMPACSSRVSAWVEQHAALLLAIFGIFLGIQVGMAGLAVALLVERTRANKLIFVPEYF